MVAKLERKRLTEAFPEKSFSDWVRENLDEINKITNLSLTGATRERAAGDFRVDIVAEQSGGGIVIIENQLGTSNHDHLGKLLTYLAAYEATAAIWVVEEPRVEHVDAIAWLNQSTSAEFYMMKVEAVRIGTSDFAPLLTLIVGPSDESKQIAEDKEQFALRHHERIAFWKRLLEIANRRTALHSGRSPTKDSYLWGSSGKSGIGFVYTILEHSARVELWIELDDQTETKVIFDKLIEHRQQIDTAFGRKLEWLRQDQNKRSRIQISSETGGYRDPERREDICNWMVENMSSFERIFKPEIKSLFL